MFLIKTQNKVCWGFSVSDVYRGLMHDDIKARGKETSVWPLAFSTQLKVLKKKRKKTTHKKTNQIDKFARLTKEKRIFKLSDQKCKKGHYF